MTRPKLFMAWVAALTISMPSFGTFSDEESFARELSVRELVRTGAATDIAAAAKSASPIEQERALVALREIAFATAEPKNRAAAFDALIEARRLLLKRHADDPRSVTWALDLLEATLLLGPSLDGSDVFALVGIDADAPRIAITREDVLAAFRVATVPIRGEGDATRSLARDRSTRGPVLQTIAEARLGSALVAADAFGSEDARALASRAQDLPPAARDLMRISLARQGGDAEALLSAVERAPDATPLHREAATSMRLLLRAERGDASAAGDALERLTTLRGGDALSRLLAADAAARCLQVLRAPTSIEPWIRAYGSASAKERVLLREAIFRRMRSILGPLLADTVAELPPLAVVALAASAAKELLPSLIARLERVLDDPSDSNATTSARGPAEFELGRALSRAQRYEDAARRFRHFAEAFPEDPLAAEAMDLAVTIDSEMALADPSSLERRASLRATLTSALDRFPEHAQWNEWRLLLATAAVADRDPDAALAALRLIPSTADNATEARLLEAESHLLRVRDADKVALPAILIAIDHALQALESSTLSPKQSHRRALVIGQQQRLTGNLDAADATLRTLVGDTGATLEIRSAAIAALIQLREDRGGVIEFSPEMAAFAKSAPLAFWNAVRTWTLEACRGTSSDLEPINGGDELAKRRLSALGAPIAATLVDLSPLPVSRDEALSIVRTLLSADAPLAAASLATRLAALRPDDMDVALVSAEAKRRCGGDRELAAAMSEFVAIGDRVTESTTAWWQAQLGQVRIAASSPALGKSDRAAILTRVQRLRGIDPAFGGGRHRASFEAVEKRLLVGGAAKSPS